MDTEAKEWEEAHKIKTARQRQERNKAMKKPRQGNGLMGTTYLWSQFDWLVYLCSHENKVSTRGLGSEDWGLNPLHGSNSSRSLSVPVLSPGK